MLLRGERREGEDKAMGYGVPLATVTVALVAYLFDLSGTVKMERKFTQKRPKSWSLQ